MANHLQSLFVDSRFRSTGTGTQFTIALPENIDCSGDAVCSCVAFSAPVTFWTVEAGLRDQLVVWFTTRNEYGPFFAQLVPGQYDGFQWATMVKAQLNAAKDNFGEHLPDFECIYVPSENRHGFSWGSATDEQRTWRFITPEQALVGDLPSSWNWTSLDPKRLATRTMNLDPNPSVVSNADSYITGYYDTFGGVSEFYLRSNTLTQGRNMGPRLGKTGVDRDSLIRVPITVDHGAVLHWSPNGVSYYWVSVAYLGVRQIDFTLVDADGNVIDLHGGVISFHLIFHSAP